MKQKVKVSRFLDWYFSESSDVNSFGMNCIELLKLDGSIKISVQDILDGCFYVPEYICEGFEAESSDNEYASSDIELIQD